MNGNGDPVGRSFQQGTLILGKCRKRADFHNTDGGIVENKGDHENVSWLFFPKGGRDPNVIFRNPGQEDGLFFQGRLADQALAEAECIGQVLSGLVGIAGLEPEGALAVMDKDGAHLGAEIFHQKGDHLAAEAFHRLFAAHPVVQFALPGFEPVVLGLKGIGFFQGYHGVPETVVEQADFVVGGPNVNQFSFSGGDPAGPCRQSLDRPDDPARGQQGKNQRQHPDDYRQPGGEAPNGPGGPQGLIDVDFRQHHPLQILQIDGPVGR